MINVAVPRTRLHHRTVDLAAHIGGLRPVVVLVAMALWFHALQDIDLSRMNDYGLISVLPVQVFLAVAVLNVSFCMCLRAQPLRTPLVVLHVLALVVMLYGITALVEPLPRFESAWKHVGVTEYILRNGSIDSRINAYFNWPGFFIGLAFLTRLLDLPSALPLVAWTPVVLNVLYLGPLIMIFRRGTTDARLIWLAVWTFYLANWIGQDYLSPQGFSYFLFLTILAILLTWFEVTSTSHPVFRLLKRFRLPVGRAERLYQWIAPADLPMTSLSAAQRKTLVVLIVATFTAIVASHQLTPFALLGAVTALVVLNRCNLTALPIIMGIILVTWLRFFAEAYFAGHAEHITSQVGAVGETVTANMTSRLSGSTGHVMVVYARTAMTVALWLVAFIGGLRRLSKGHRDFTLALLALVPFPLVFFQSYGGEMLLRIYLFSLPFMAFFAAAIFYRDSQVGDSWLTTGSLVLVCLAASGLFFLTRYGNERMDYFTEHEYEAARVLYEIAPPGSLLVAGTVKTPWKYQDFEKFRYRTLADDIEWRSTDPAEPDLESIHSMMDDQAYPASFLLITRSQIANDQMFGLLPVPLQTLKDALVASDRFQVVYSNPDAVILMAVDSHQSGP